MIKRILFLVFIAPGFLFAQNQEIATFVTYNLLNYRNETTYCTSTNNSSLAKEGYLKTIFDYVDADLIACNEIGANPSNAAKILDRCLNVDGETKYVMAPYAASSGSYLTNAFFFNGDMFEILGTDAVKKELGGDDIVRLINVYYLYYKDANLPLGADTTYLTVFVGHLKAGNTTSDKVNRADASEAIMDFIENENVTGNYIICGDLNTYTSSEGAIQNLIDPTNQAVKFNDPVNRMGSWNNNSAYADVHTQSTHATSNGCASGGGLDDRFDFVLVSNAIDNDDDHMEYVSNSYKAVANDGNHFNQAINNPGNSSVPATVLDAIYNMSDHLPVVMDMIITEASPNSISDVSQIGVKVQIPNPSKGNLIGEISGPDGSYGLKVYSVTGQVLLSETILIQGETKFDYDLSASGVVFVEVLSPSGHRQVIKLIRN